MTWNKFSMWVAAFVVQAQIVYPGLDGEMIVQSLKDGTFVVGVLNVGLAMIVTRAAVLIKGKKREASTERTEE